MPEDQFIENVLQKSQDLRCFENVFPQHRDLLESISTKVELFRAGRVGHTREITEFFNEIIIALWLAEQCNQQGWELLYEPICPNGKSIDFCIIRRDEENIYVDVKTIHPKQCDAIATYQSVLERGLIADNCGLQFQQLDFENQNNAPVLDGVQYHYVAASRAKFLEYTIELEEKISSLNENAKFFMFFCGSGFRWAEDDLEDFVDFYYTGRHRADDPWSRMELFKINEDNIPINQTIHRFGYMKRKQYQIEACRLNCSVRGPNLGR